MNIHTVAVTFNESTLPYKNKRYHYLTNRNDIAVGDVAVVMSPTAGPVCVTVKEVWYNTQTSAAFKYLVDKVDFDDYNRVQQEIEAAANERRRKAKEEAELRAEIQKLERGIAARKEEIRLEIINREAAVDPFIRQQQERINELKSFGAVIS